MKLSTRLAAGTLAGVLPVAGCPTEKKRTVEAELAAASDNLLSTREQNL